ncbi:hypothetical protein [Marinomonas transparens]|uniref:Uncharacterized protein n=1 Tax=Marinomonas transparens TaxID=2795388 RepID=A0A934N3V2_9GAMM|nr:hypothetical protein [Marinomonas transparens]MBJ7540067.1 hypothetical protein [Marinomonas transparens]
MDTNKLIETLKDVRLDELKIEPEKIKAYEIMSITDIEVLKALCRYIESFKKLSLPEVWPAGEGRQSILGLMDYLNKYLSDLNVHKCYCVGFKYLEADIFNQSDDGFVDILESSEVIGESVKYECKCNGCSKILEVTHSLDSTGGDSYVWRQKSD